MPALQSWISPKTRKGMPSKIHGKGLFALEPISKGEVLAIKLGRIIDRATLLQNLKIVNNSQEQITDELYIAPLTTDEEQASMIYVNHSCTPNAGWQGQVVIVAIRDIDAGEEVLIDYAMHSDDDILDFRCACQTSSCRHHITGRDWRLPALQEKYEGYFVWFIEQKIKETRHG